MDKKKSAAVLLAMLALVLALWGWGKTHADSPKLDMKASVAEDQSTPTPSTAVPLTTQTTDVERRSSDEAPIIDSVRVEPSVVCAGEEAIAEIQAHAPHDENGVGIHMLIGGIRGNRVPLIGELTLDGNPRQVLGHVYGSGGELTTVPIPLTVRDCVPSRRALVTALRLANSFDEYQFTARVLDVPARGQKAPFMAASDVSHYRWKFGDGKTEESTSPTVAHSYEERDQTKRVSSFLVTVEAVLKSGGYVKGHVGIEATNAGRAALLDKGKVLILSSSRPRFAEAHEDGSVTQRVRLFHVMPDAVTVTGVTARVVYSDERGELAPAQDVGSGVLGATAIPAGHGIDVPLMIDAKDEAVSMVIYTVSGIAKDGTAASGTFSIMRPSPPPTKEHSTEVTDAAFAEKIRAAQKALGKPYVTAEEIAQLSREGRI